jgi:hypothetical protein
MGQQPDDALSVVAYDDAFVSVPYRDGPLEGVEIVDHVVGASLLACNAFEVAPSDVAEGFVGQNVGNVGADVDFGLIWALGLQHFPPWTPRLMQRC